MIELPTEVIGYHGTSRDAVPGLLARDIQLSDQHFEWPGTGLLLVAGLAVAGAAGGRSIASARTQPSSWPG